MAIFWGRLGLAVLPLINVLNRRKHDSTIPFSGANSQSTSSATAAQRNRLVGMVRVKSNAPMVDAAAVEAKLQQFADLQKIDQTATKVTCHVKTSESEATDIPERQPEPRDSIFHNKKIACPRDLPLPLTPTGVHSQISDITTQVRAMLAKINAFRAKVNAVHANVNTFTAQLDNTLRRLNEVAAQHEREQLIAHQVCGSAIPFL